MPQPLPPTVNYALRLQLSPTLEGKIYLLLSHWTGVFRGHRARDGSDSGCRAFDFPQIRHADTVYHVMEFIRSNYDKKIGLDTVADHVHLSSAYVGSLFRRKTGQTVSDYLNQVRIEKSKALLTCGDLPVSEIAYLCGFGDQSYFARVFKKQTGISPGKFRQQIKGQE